MIELYFFLFESKIMIEYFLEREQYIFFRKKAHYIYEQIKVM